VKKKQQPQLPAQYQRIEALVDEVGFEMGIHVCKHAGCAFWEWGVCKGEEGRPCVIESYYIESMQKNPIAMLQATHQRIVAKWIVRWERFFLLFMNPPRNVKIRDLRWLDQAMMRIERELLKMIRAVSRKNGSEGSGELPGNPEQLREFMSEWITKRREDGLEQDWS
jgi:hypothetical protein